MEFNASLDVNLVAHDSADEVAVLLEVAAPAAAVEATRVPASLQVVLDRSGSMGGAPLEGAKRALIGLVRRLEPTDNFGLVAFDDTARVVVPAGPLTNKQLVISQIEAIQAGGSTDLGAGYLRGLREIRRVATAGDSSLGGTVLIVSDGHVNVGLQDPAEFASIATKAYADRLVTSTLGYGQGYDETLLSELARSGSGNHVFAADPDAAGAAIAKEVDGLLSKVVQGLALTVECGESVELLRLFNDLPATQLADGRVMIELGDLYAAETRKVLLKLKVPAMADLGLQQIATLDLAYVELPALVEHTFSLPISVNVVPGDEAAGRVPHPTVHSEVLFQEAQDVKRRASEAYERGEFDEGERLMGETRSRLAESLAAAPDAIKIDIQAELDSVENMSALSSNLGAAGAPMISKMSRDSYHQASRKRGRR